MLVFRCEQRGEVGVCDSREMPVIYFRPGSDDDTELKAAVRLQGRFSNRDAVGAHLELLPDSTDSSKSNSGHRHWWVRSTNGFQSQNSAWILLPLGEAPQGHQRELRVTWPRGHVSIHEVSAWERSVLLEPLAAGAHSLGALLAPA